MQYGNFLKQLSKKLGISKAKTDFVITQFIETLYEEINAVEEKKDFLNIKRAIVKVRNNSEKKFFSNLVKREVTVPARKTITIKFRRTK